MTALPKSEGEILTANNVNTHTLHRKQFADATTRTINVTGTLTDTLTVFTLTTPVSAVINFIDVKFFLNISTGDAGAMSIKVVGSNLGTKFYSGGVANGGGTGAANSGVVFSSSEADLVSTDGLTYRITLPPFVTLDTSTVFTFRIRSDGGAGNFTELSAVTMDVYYTEGFIED